MTACGVRALASRRWPMSGAITSSIGFTSGEHTGRNSRRPPVASIAVRARPSSMHRQGVLGHGLPGPQRRHQSLRHPPGGEVAAEGQGNHQWRLTGRSPSRPAGSGCRRVYAGPILSGGYPVVLGPASGWSGYLSHRGRPGPRRALGHRLSPGGALRGSPFGADRRLLLRVKRWRCTMQHRVAGLMVSGFLSQHLVIVGMRGPRGVGVGGDLPDAGAPPVERPGTAAGRAFDLGGGEAGLTGPRSRSRRSRE